MSNLTTRTIQKLENNFSQYLQKYNKTEDETLSRKELLNAIIHNSRGYINQLSAANMVNQIFQLFDQDNDDMISINDIREKCGYFQQSVAGLTLISPQNGANFTHWPRNTFLKWKPVVSATSYLVEVEYETDGKWHQFLNRSQCRVNTTSFQFRFVGPFRGRWRVTALNRKGKAIAKSNWSIFTYSRLTQRAENPPEKQVVKPLRFRW